MHDAAAAVPAWVMIAYLIAGICFILALRGLSSPATSQRGNRLGMAGMAIAVVTTLTIHDIASLPEILAAIGVGAAVGPLVLRRRIRASDQTNPQGATTSTPVPKHAASRRIAPILPAISGW